MSTAYSTTEIYTKIRTLDTEIANLRQRALLNYQMGRKTVKEDRHLDMLLKERKMWDDRLTQSTATISERTVITDYEMDRFGNQLGQEVEGDD